jgi:copper transport protein
MQRLLTLIFVFAAAWSVTSPVKAHANVVRSIPAAGAVLDQSPTAIILEFSEDLDPGFTRVELFDESGGLVSAGPGTIDPQAPRVLRLEIHPLPQGTYSAVWRARSAADGHVTEGSVGFSIGASSPPASLLPPPGAPDPATAMPSRIDAIARWFSYLATALALGSLTFVFFTCRPVYLFQTGKASVVDEDILHISRRLSITGLLCLSVITVCFLLIQAAQASEVPLGRVFGAPVLQLFLGRTGQLLGIRWLLAIALAAVVLRLPAEAFGQARLWWLMLMLGGGVLLTFSLQSHAAARGSAPGVVVDWLHLAAMTTWLGGLLPLFVVVRQKNALASEFVERFSDVSLFSVGTLAVTGMYNLAQYVQTWEALLSTTYGRALIFKTGLFGILIALGAVNLLVLSPRLRKAGQNAGRWLGRTVRVEFILGSLLLFVVGVLTGVAPAFEALEAHHDQGLMETATVDGVNILLRVAPGQVGDNDFGVEFNDSRPGASNVPSEVLLRFTMTGMDMGTQQVEAVSVDGIRYTARGSYVTMSGPWSLEVIIRRPGFDDVRHVFNLKLQRAPAP